MKTYIFRNYTHSHVVIGSFDAFNEFHVAGLKIKENKALMKIIWGITHTHRALKDNQPSCTLWCTVLTCSEAKFKDRAPVYLYANIHTNIHLTINKKKTNNNNLNYKIHTCSWLNSSHTRFTLLNKHKHIHKESKDGKHRAHTKFSMCKMRVSMRL